MTPTDRPERSALSLNAPTGLIALTSAVLLAGAVAAAFAEWWLAFATWITGMALMTFSAIRWTSRVRAALEASRASAQGQRPATAIVQWPRWARVTAVGLVIASVASLAILLLVLVTLVVARSF
jgi:hypothetical protein